MIQVDLTQSLESLQVKNLQWLWSESDAHVIVEEGSERCDAARWRLEEEGQS